MDKDEEAQYYNSLKSDLNLLAKFVFLYEKEIKLVHRLDDFKKKYPNAELIFKKTIQSKVKQAKLKYIQDRQEEEEGLIFTGRDCQVLDFCRHLRNSFCHALIKREGKLLYIPDRSRGKKTSVGAIEYKRVKEFIIELTK